MGALPDLLVGRDAEAYAKALKGYIDKGVPGSWPAGSRCSRTCSRR